MGIAMPQYMNLKVLKAKDSAEAALHATWQTRADVCSKGMRGTVDFHIELINMPCGT
jgi:hypothetical protein